MVFQKRWQIVIFIIKRYLLAYGIFYIRVFTSGLVLMIIGTTLLYIGVYYLGEVVVLPIDKFLNPLPPPYSSYVMETPIILIVNLEENPVYVDTIVFKKPGYLIISISSEELALVEISIINRKTYESYGMIVTNNPLISNKYYYNVIIQKPGEYDLYIRDLGSSKKTVSLKIDKYVLVESLDGLLAKWLQGLGGFIFLVGLFIIILSPVIASKQAEAVYLTPKKVREQIAGMGIIRRHRVEESE